MKLTHIDDVHKSAAAAFHNGALEVIERSVAAAVARGDQQLNVRELGFKITPELDEEMVEAGLKWLKSEEVIVWGDKKPETTEDKPKAKK